MAVGESAQRPCAVVYEPAKALAKFLSAHAEPGINTRHQLTRLALPNTRPLNGESLTYEKGDKALDAFAVFLNVVQLSVGGQEIYGDC